MSAIGAPCRLCRLILFNLLRELLYRDHLSEQRIGGEINLRDTVFKKYSDFVKLKNSDAFVFVEENPLSINDGFFLVSEPGGGNDRPAVNHGLASSFSYADGHAALHEWHDYLLGRTGNTDNYWLAAHVTVLK